MPGPHERGEQDHRDRRPAPPLRPWIRRYRGYRYSGMAPGTHQGIPSGGITFIVSIAEPTEITTMPGGQSPGSFDAFVGGLHTRPATISHPGFGSGVAIELSPFGCRALFGVPAAALATYVVDLRDLIGPDAGELVERLSASVSWPDRFDVLDEVLSRGLSEAKSPSAEVSRAWELLAATGGRMAISELASSVGWSRRHLATRFRAELGLLPKVAARVLRFERACGLLDRGIPLADAAVMAGYYDQAHMTNEWCRLSGATPTAWLGDELRDRAVEASRPM
jgi:AraC-like DNA-binding protein